MNIKQIQGFTALHECSINVAMNGNTVRNAQMGSTCQFHTNTRVSMEISCGIMHRAKAVIMATELRITLLLCSLILVCLLHDSTSIFLLSAFRAHAIVPYTMVKIQIGTTTKMMKVAVTYLLCVSIWSNAGAQRASQYVTLSLPVNSLKV